MEKQSPLYIWQNNKHQSKTWRQITLVKIFRELIMLIQINTDACKKRLHQFPYPFSKKCSQIQNIEAISRELLNQDHESVTEYTFNAEKG